MKIDLTDVSPVRKKLVVEADAAAVEKERKEVTAAYARKANIPGFRPGKAPMSVIRSRFAREVQEDVKDRLVARLWAEAIEKENLKVIGDPVLQEVTFEEGEPFRFKATIEIAPDFTPKNSPV